MDTINEIKRQELPEEQEIDLIERDLSGFVSGCGAEYPVSVGIVSGRGYR